MRALLLIGILIATFGLFTTAGCSVMDAHPRTTLHLATAADLGTTAYILHEGGREANPVLAHVIDEHGLLTMVAGQVVLNEVVLMWERRACRGDSAFFYWRSCSLARTIRLGFTFGHLAGAGWNTHQILKAQ